MKTKKEPNEFRMPVELDDGALDSVSGGASAPEVVREPDSNAGLTDKNKMCELGLCPYTNRQDCPMYHVLPQFCVR